MKQTKLYTLKWLFGIVLFVCATLLSPVKSIANNRITKIYVNSNGFDEGKKPAKKEKTFKNQNVVKVFPDIIRKSIHVVAKADIDKDIDFLVFDVNGNLVLNYKMKAGERKSITNLKRGSYMYHVFSDDEYLTTGKLEFR